MRRELLAEDVERARHVRGFGPFVDDVVLGIRLHKSARGSTSSTPHISDEEATRRCQLVVNVSADYGLGLPVGFGTDLIGDGAEDCAVALQELRVVGVGNVKVERRILGLKQRQKPTTN